MEVEIDITLFRTDLYKIYCDYSLIQKVCCNNSNLTVGPSLTLFKEKFGNVVLKFDLPSQRRVPMHLACQVCRLPRIASIVISRSILVEYFGGIPSTR